MIRTLLAAAPTVLLLLLVLMLAGWQVYDYHTFRTAGPRFTAEDGQALCERVRALETAAGLPAAPCRYLDP